MLTKIGTYPTNLSPSNTVAVNPATDICVTKNTDLEVVAKKSEYTIIGDRLYTSFTGDPPLWLQEMMNTIMNQTINNTVSSLEDLRDGLLSALDSIEVAENTYNSSIVSFRDELASLNGVVNTLNSTVNSNNATILQTLTTLATKDFATSVAIDRIESSVNEGLIKSRIDILNTSISTVDKALADSVTLLTARYNEVSDAQSSLENTVEADRNKAMANFAYNASLKLTHNGVPYYYRSGFGLKTILKGGNHEGAPSGSSEFWINAERFKFTNENMTGSTAAFSIDASGTTPKVKFNGEVEFTNVSGTEQLLEDIQTALGSGNNAKEDIATRLGYTSYADMVAKAVAGSTVIKGGYINTNLIEAGSINADHIDARNLSVKEAADFTGDLQSTNFLTGVRGWRLRKTGDIELNGAQIRGLLDFGQITVQGRPGSEVANLSALSTTASIPTGESTTTVTNSGSKVTTFFDITPTGRFDIRGMVELRLNIVGIISSHEERTGTGGNYTYYPVEVSASATLRIYSIVEGVKQALLLQKTINYTQGTRGSFTSWGDRLEYNINESIVENMSLSALGHIGEANNKSVGYRVEVEANRQSRPRSLRGTVDVAISATSIVSNSYAYLNRF